MQSMFTVNVQYVSLMLGLVQPFLSRISPAPIGKGQQCLYGSFLALQTTMDAAKVLGGWMASWKSQEAAMLCNFVPWQSCGCLSMDLFPINHHDLCGIRRAPILGAPKNVKLFSLQWGLQGSKKCQTLLPTVGFARFSWQTFLPEFAWLFELPF